MSFDYEKMGGNGFDYRQAEKFIEMVDYCGLVDLGFIGPAYTWTNKRQIEHNIRERLDKVLASTEWCDKFPNASVSHLPIINSDNNPILLICEHITPRKKHVARVEAHWFQYHRFSDILKDIWHKRLSHCSTLHSKLSNCLPILKS